MGYFQPNLTNLSKFRGSLAKLVETIFETLLY